jgi:hypothetical protein
VEEVVLTEVGTSVEVVLTMVEAFTTEELIMVDRDGNITITTIMDSIITIIHKIGITIGIIITGTMATIMAAGGVATVGDGVQRD